MALFKHSLHYIFATGLVLGLAGCGSDENGAGADPVTPTPTPGTTGTINVNYTFSGNEAPTKVRLLLIDGLVSGETCTTLAFNPATGIVNDRPNLPINGSLNFSSIAAGNKFLVVALGEKTDGTRIAKGCRDQVNVIAGQTTTVDLSLTNWIGDMNGVYQVAQDVNLGLPTQITNVLLALQAACGFLNQPDLCTLVSDVNQILTSLDVVSVWTIDQQADGSFIGTVHWVTVQGVDVGSIDLVEGTFVGEVPGSTVMNYKDFNSTIQFGNLVLFVVEDVLDFDLGVLGLPGAALVQALANNYVSPLTFQGTGTLLDADHNGVNEKIDGGLTGHLQVSSWGHDFALDYHATRQ